MLAGNSESQSAFGVGYINDLVMVCGGYVYIGEGATLSTATNNGAIPVQSTALVSMMYLSPNVYIAGGLSTVAVLNMPTLTLSTATTSTSTSTSAGTVPTYCWLTANWRGRFILAQDINNPQNVYASRLGDPYDFNYAATDPAAAWAANFSESGQIGEPVTAFIPFNDDLAVVSCINSVWLIEGDPSDGGSFVLLSNTMGIVGPRAWCTDAAHTLYFVGTSGLYSLRPFWAQYQPPQNLTDKTWMQFFQGLDRNQSQITLVYDEVNQYIKIGIAPYSPTESTSPVGSTLIFDLRNGGLWPQGYGGDATPFSIASYVPGYALTSVDADGWPIGPAVPQQTIALGGSEGCVYQASPSTTYDQTVTGNYAISSYATFGPINPIPDSMALLHAVEMDMGELPPQYSTSTGIGWNALITVVAGAVAADVDDTGGYSYPTQDSTSNAAGYNTWMTNTQLDRRQPIWRPRLGAAWYALEISNSTISTTWSFETATMTFAQNGINRYRR